MREHCWASVVRGVKEREAAALAGTRGVGDGWDDERQGGGAGGGGGGGAAEAKEKGGDGIWDIVKRWFTGAKGQTS